VRKNLHSLLVGTLFWIAAAVLPGPILAAGGAHIVDDSEVETPGTCHVEFWVSRFVPGDGYANVGPACTFLKIPWLEVGAAYQHYWDEITAGPLIGPQFKINFQSASAGLGFALGLNAGVNARTGELGLAGLTALVTVPVTDALRINLNAGWSYLNGDNPNALFWGGQVEVDVGWDVTLMLEAFGRQPGVIGNQMGLRYTPSAHPRFDFDLLVGTIFDQDSTKFFTLGVTVRF
jgi:hypothetical protein